MSQSCTLTHYKSRTSSHLKCKYSLTTRPSPALARRRVLQLGREDPITTSFDAPRYDRERDCVLVARARSGADLTRVFGARQENADALMAYGRV